MLLKAPNFQAPLDSMLFVAFYRGDAYTQMHTIPAKDVSLVLNRESGSSSIPQLPQVHTFGANTTTVSILHLMSALQICLSQHLWLNLMSTCRSLPHACTYYTWLPSSCADGASTAVCVLRVQQSEDADPSCQHLPLRRRCKRAWRR